MDAINDHVCSAWWDSIKSPIFPFSLLNFIFFGIASRKDSGFSNHTKSNREEEEEEQQQPWPVTVISRARMTRSVSASFSTPCRVSIRTKKVRTRCAQLDQIDTLQLLLLRSVGERQEDLRHCQRNQDWVAWNGFGKETTSATVGGLSLTSHPPL